MKEYFNLQIRMTNRRLIDLGFMPIIAYPIILTAFLAASIYLFYEAEFAQYLYVLLPLSIMIQICEAPRIEFLRISFSDRSFRKLRTLENIAVALPFLIFLIYKGAYLTALALGMLSIFLVSFSKKTSTSSTIPSPFFQNSFEFTAGVRSTSLVFPLIYGLACIAVWVGNLNLALFAMLLIFAVSISYYQKLENEYFVWSYNLRPKYFLLRKVKSAVLYSTLLIAPVLVLISISFFEHAAFIVTFLVAGYAFLICVVFAKYSSYPHGLNLLGGLMIGLCLILPPLLLILISYFFIVSARRLEPLLK